MVVGVKVMLQLVSIRPLRQQMAQVRYESSSQQSAYSSDIKNVSEGLGQDNAGVELF
jgi:hypothetical protein